MAFVMLIMIRLLSNAAVEYDVKQELKRSVDKNVKYVNIEKDKIEMSEEFLYQDEYVCFLIIQRNGKVLAGKYPEEVAVELGDCSAKQNLSRSVLCNGEKYYFRDVRVGRNDDKGVFVRGVMKKADVYSPYRTIELISYLSLLGVFLLVFICEFVLSKKISKELKNMCETAESIGTNMDMSRRMEYEGQFQEIAVFAQANNRMLDRMEETFQQQEQFTSDVAHELRTPVAVMLAECQYAEGRVMNQEEFDEFFDVVHRQSKKINTIITQLLNFSRLDQNREQLKMEKINLADIAEVICEEQQEKAGDRVTIELQTQDAVTIGDINLLSIVIQNLVSNAVKFSYEKGKIEIRTGEEENQIYLSVKDYGMGIRAEDLERIFRRFYKCDTSRNAEGFGLGLPLSLKIAEKHGGTIKVQSEEGKGSKFTLLLKKEQG